MKFLLITTSWTNAQLFLFKLCVFSFGIIAGLYFYDSLKGYLPYITGFSIITVIWVAYLWIKKMRSPVK